MSAANISLVKNLYAAFGRNDISTIIAAMAPNVAWFIVGRREDYPLLGVRKGPKAVNEFFRLVAENQEVRDFTPRDFYAAGEMVFVLGHYAWKVRKTGKSVDTEWAHVFQVKNGKVISFREFTDTAQFAQAWRT
jgi:hypothetical protein